MAGSTTDAEALVGQLLQADASYAPWRDRKALRGALERTGLPRLRSEAWRHTNAERWYASALAGDVPVPSPGNEVTAAAPVEVAEFSEARAVELARPHLGTAFDMANQPLAALNGALLGSGIVVHAPAGSHGEPVRIGDLSSAFQHVLVVVPADAALVLIEEPTTFAHRIVEVIVGERASVEHRRRQAAGSHRECSLVAARVATGASYALAQTSRGADLRRNDIEVNLGEGAKAELSGAWRVDGRTHLDTQAAVYHAEPGAFSRQTFRGVAGGRGRAVVNGRIHIATGANGSDAALSAKNLVTGAAAQVFAKPELQIHASDVQCSHGVTVGALDDDAIHYLRSRGIGEAAAERLLVEGFLREAIADAEGAKRIGLAA